MKDTADNELLLLKVASREQEDLLTHEASISQGLHTPTIQPNLLRVIEIFEGARAERSLASLDEDVYRKLSDGYNTEQVSLCGPLHFLSESGEPLGAQHLPTFAQLCRSLHVEQSLHRSGVPLSGSPYAIDFFEAIGRDLAALLRTLSTNNTVHGALHPQGLLLAVAPSLLLKGTLPSTHQALLLAIDLSEARPHGSPIELNRHDFAYQSPQRLQALIGGAHENDNKDDVFSVGALLFSLLTGAPPYAPEEHLPWVEKVRSLHQQWQQNEGPPRLSFTGIDWLAPDIIDTIIRMCAYSREERPSPEELTTLFSRPWSKTRRKYAELFDAPLPPSLDALVLHADQLSTLSKRIIQTSWRPIQGTWGALPGWFGKLAEHLQKQREAQEQELFQKASQEATARAELDATKAELVSLQERLESFQQEQEQKEVALVKQEQALADEADKLRQDAFEEGYKQGQQEAATGGPLRIDVKSAGPMQTQNIASTAVANLSQINDLDEQMVQLKQEYSELRSLLRLERESFDDKIRKVLEVLDERDKEEEKSLLIKREEIANEYAKLNQQLQALQAEQEVIQAALSGLQSRFESRQDKAPTGPIETPLSEPQELAPLLLEEEVFQPYTFSQEKLDPATDEVATLMEKHVPDQERPPLRPPEGYNKGQVLTPSALPMLDGSTSLPHLDGFEDDDEPAVIIGTPAVPSQEELPQASKAPPAQSPPPATGGHSSFTPVGLTETIKQDSAIQKLNPALQSDILAFFEQLQKIEWFNGLGPPKQAAELLQMHIERLEPFAAHAGKAPPKMLAVFRSGMHRIHRLTVPSEQLSRRVEEVFDLSLSKRPGDWSFAGGAVWSSLRQYGPQQHGSRFENNHWLVPWDAACDTILETTWFAANDVAWSAARDAPRFTASDLASETANACYRAPARSTLWSLTWEFVRKHATGVVLSAPNNAASDLSNDIAWRLVQDHMAEKGLRNPFSPLFQIWSLGWWPIHLASGDYILWAPLSDPEAIEVLWEVERGETRQ